MTDHLDLDQGIAEILKNEPTIEAARTVFEAAITHLSPKGQAKARARFEARLPAKASNRHSAAK